MVFVDSNFWIGYLNLDDKHSREAHELLPDIENSDEIIYVTSGIVHEVVNHLFKSKGKAAALQALNLFLSTPRMEILFLTEPLWKKEIAFFIEHEMNLTDTQILAAMHEKNDFVIYSFDRHFDQAEKIKRMY